MKYKIPAMLLFLTGAAILAFALFVPKNHKPTTPPPASPSRTQPDGSMQTNTTPEKKPEPTTRQPEKRIPPLQIEDITSVIDNFIKPEKKPTPEELEAERQVLLDLPTLMKEKNLKMGAPVFIRAFKEERELEVFLQNDEGTFELLRTYSIAAASGRLGPKLAEGDNQVPEGFYYSSQSSMKPDSAFHLAFNIGYPNAYDRAHGRTGSYIMVHGSNVSIGCLAMTDEKIEEIYGLCQAALNAGQPFFRVHIFPFRMTEKRMQQAASSEHYEFWKNLKTGYDLFENTRIPPNAGVKDKQYTFE